MAEIKANFGQVPHCKKFWCHRFQLGSRSQIATFWGHAPLILQPRGTPSSAPLEKSWIRPCNSNECSHGC